MTNQPAQTRPDPMSAAEELRRLLAESRPDQPHDEPRHRPDEHPHEQAHDQPPDRVHEQDHQPYQPTADTSWPDPSPVARREISLWPVLAVTAVLAGLTAGGVLLGPRLFSRPADPVPASSQVMPTRTTDSPGRPPGPRAQLGRGFDRSAPRPLPAGRPSELGFTARNGFAVNEFGEDVRGAVVTRVERDGAARRGAVRVGDTVTAVNDIRVRSTKELRRALLAVDGERTLRFRVIRATKTRELSVANP